MCHVLGLPGFGVLLLQKHYAPLNRDLLLSLQSLMGKLAIAALACRYEEALQQQISAREQANQQLRASEHRFRTLFEQTPNIAVQGYDAQRRVMFWNPENRLKRTLFGVYS